MSFRQQKPVVASMLHQPPPGLHQSLLQARQRPILNPLRQFQPPPQIPQVVSQQAQCQPDLVRAEPMARKPRHLHRLLAFLDPLLRRPSLVIEAHYRPARCLKVGHDEPHSWEQLPEVELHLRHHPSRPLPTRRLVEKAPCTTRWAYGSAVLPGASAAPRYPVPGCRWQESEWRTSRPAPPGPRRSPAWQRRRQRETPPPGPASAAVRSRATRVLPNPRRYARCPDAAWRPDSLPRD